MTDILKRLEDLETDVAILKAMHSHYGNDHSHCGNDAYEHYPEADIPPGRDERSR